MIFSAHQPYRNAGDLRIFYSLEDVKNVFKSPEVTVGLCKWKAEWHSCSLFLIYKLWTVHRAMIYDDSYALIIIFDLFVKKQKVFECIKFIQLASGKNINLL